MPDTPPKLFNFDGEPLAPEDLKFFFVFSMNNSGTTVMSQYAAAQFAGYLPPFGNNEGQMVPAVRSMMRDKPWSPTRTFDWKFIRSEWEKLARGRVFIEGSPPNILRVEEIHKVFGHDSSAVITICDPYQHVASSLRAYRSHPDTVKIITASWVRHARVTNRIRRNYRHFLFLPYERFVAGPIIFNRRMNLPKYPVRIAGKAGSGIVGIKSGFARAVSFLEPEEITKIRDILQDASMAVGKLRYTAYGPEILDRIQAEDPEEFAIGRKRRAEWNAKHGLA